MADVPLQAPFESVAGLRGAEKTQKHEQQEKAQKQEQGGGGRGGGGSKGKEAKREAEGAVRLVFWQC